MRSGQTAMSILNKMQKFDQKITPARLSVQQRSDFCKRRIIQLPSLGPCIVAPSGFSGSSPVHHIELLSRRVPVTSAHPKS
jgi:hypothetical protein